MSNDQIIDFSGKKRFFNRLCATSGKRRSAGVTQLVEYELPKLGVAGSNPVARSIVYTPFRRARHKLDNGPVTVFETKSPNP